jgi:selenocysteine lyase/cysteine desulfurase
MTDTVRPDPELRRSLAATARLDHVRAVDFARLDEGGHTYLDHTGAAPAPRSLVEGHLEALRDSVLGNPHSHNPASAASTALVEEARAAVLAFVGADPATYDCVFTANASGAIRLVGEAFPFGPDRPLALAADNHNSVNGVREHARRAGAAVEVVPLAGPDLRLDLDAARGVLEGTRPGLWCVPAQSNYSGVRHPLSLVGEARTGGWRVLLDAAAYAATSRLRLGDDGPDFLALSLYKLVGYPTGVGMLVARHDALAELRRPAFAGGTVAVASVAADGHRLVPGHAGFEDGTPDFLAMPAITAGLAYLDDVLDDLHRRVGDLTAWLLARLGELRHRDGRPLVQVLGPGGTGARGGTIACNLVDPSGTPLRDARVEELAAARNISLRSGCFCNPGAGEHAQGLVAADLAPFLDPGRPASFCDVDDALWARRGRGVSALRISVGLGTDAGDAERVVDFLAGFRDVTAAEVGTGPVGRPPEPDAA